MKRPSIRKFLNSLKRKALKHSARPARKSRLLRKAAAMLSQQHQINKINLPQIENKRAARGTNQHRNCSPGQSVPHFGEDQLARLQYQLSIAETSNNSYPEAFDKAIQHGLTMKSV